MSARGDAASADPTRSTGGDVGVFLAVAAVVLASRLPFLGPGYGMDADAWRVAWAARTLATTGVYEASRFPGYPVQEIASALLVRLGPVAVVGATALFSALAAGFLALIVRRLGGRDAMLAAVAFASVPACFLVSVQAMDYPWALAFMLAALHQALAARAGIAGALVGLAIGCRVTSALWLVPLAFALAHALPRAARAPAVARATVAALGVGGLAFLPVILTYGPGFLRFYEDAYPRLLFVIKNATVDLWGIPGTLAMGVALPMAMLGLARAPARTSIPRGGNALLLMLMAAAGIGLFAALYLRLPHEAAYLLPAVPLVLLALGMLIDRRAFVAVCLALLVSPWVLEVSERRPGTGVPPSAWTVPLGSTPYRLDVARGPLPTSQARRDHDARYLEQVISDAARLEGPAVIVAWEWLPLIRVRLGGKTQGEVTYVYLLTREELAEVRARGPRLYHLVGADVFNQSVHGVDLHADGVRPLE
jgi:hypothetical protein